MIVDLRYDNFQKKRQDKRALIINVSIISQIHIYYRNDKNWYLWRNKKVCLVLINNHSMARLRFQKWVVEHLNKLLVIIHHWWSKIRVIIKHWITNSKNAIRLLHPQSLGTLRCATQPWAMALSKNRCWLPLVRTECLDLKMAETAKPTPC